MCWRYSAERCLPDCGSRLGGVGPAHAATALGRTLVLVEATPGAVLLRPRHGVVQALQPHRASRADPLGLALPDLPLWLALAIGTEEEQQVFALARGSILPAPIRAGKHSRLPTYLRHGTITSTKVHQIVRYSRASGLVNTRTSPVRKPPLQDTTRLRGVVFPCTDTATL